MSNNNEIILSCKCSETIIKSRTFDEDVVKNKVCIIKGDLIYAVCKSCNTEVLLPFQRISYGPKLYLDK